MDHRIVNVANERILVFECEKCAHGASLESSPKCIRHVLTVLAEDPDVQTLLLRGNYVREYRGAGLEALSKLASTIHENKRWALLNLTENKCNRCEKPRRTKLEQIFQKSSEDPLAGFRNLQKFRSEMREKLKRGSKRCIRCRQKFLSEVIEPLVLAFQSSPLISECESKEDYVNILQPLLRPSFLSTRLMLEVPSGCTLVDSYDVCEAKVRIYHDPKKLEFLYFVIPPEYHLPSEHVELLHTIRTKLLENPPDLSSDLVTARKQVQTRAEDLLAEEIVEKRLHLSQEEAHLLASYLTRFTAGFGIVDLLLADSKIQDIYVDSPCSESAIHIYHQDFEECETNIYLTEDDLEALVSKFRFISGRPFSEANPVLDAEVCGARIALVGPSLSPHGVALAIRRHKPTPWTLPQLVRSKFLTPFAAGLLSLLVDAKTTLLVTGSRGAGKTSLLGALMTEVLPKYRILTIEDTPELPVHHLKKLGFKIQALHTRSIVSGSGIELSAAEALRTALRLGDSVVVLGEVRGEEAKVLYEAMRIGAAGNSVMGTIHGSSARDVFERVVYDLNISPSSFKATDIILTALPIRRRGGLSRLRRLFQVVEVRKGWKSDPSLEGGFKKLMSYDWASGRLKAQELRKSEVLHRIAKSWATSVEEVIANVEFRAAVCQSLVDLSEETNDIGLLEASFVMSSNLAWRGWLEKELGKKRIPYRRIFKRWRKWVRDAKESSNF